MKVYAFIHPGLKLICCALLSEAVPEGVEAVIPKINKYLVFFRIDGIFYERKEFQMLEREGDGLITFLLRSAGKKTKERIL